MFGAKKNSDGIEWHKYVRTTIKLRRDDRRRRIAEAKVAAADGLKQAGQHGAKASKSAAILLWNWLVHAAGAVTIFVRRGFYWLAGTATRSAHQLGILLARFGRLVFDFMRRVGLAPCLISAGIALGASTYLWKLRFGADRMTFTVEGVGFALIVSGALVMLFPHLVTRLRHAGFKLPANWTWRWRFNGSWLSFAGIRQAGGWTLAAICAAAGAVALWWVQPGSIGLANLPSLPSLPFVGRSEFVIGTARAINGDTLRVRGKVIVLNGIEAPELRQTCRRGNGRSWQCGVAARSALARLVQRGSVKCTVTGRAAGGSAGDDNAGRLAGSCFLGEIDLADALTAEGHVFAAPGFFSSYGDRERSARDKGLGIWRGKAERPSAFRSRQWAQAKAEAPGGCPIKGQIKRGVRIYVAPWAPDYPKVRVREARGGRWFCSEAEAQAAGWRPSINS